MKKNITIAAAFAVLVIAGCGPKEEAVTDAPKTTTETSTTATVVAYDLGSKKKGDKAICVACNSKEGTTSEEVVAETLDYKGKTYTFCNEAEKADFISDPSKYVKN